MGSEVANEIKPGRRKGAPDAAVLDPAMIVQAALDLINESGLESFSLRTLAKRLEVYPTAIYWHVPSKNELLSRAVALALQNVVPARRNGDWRVHLTSILSRLRKAIQKNPNIAPLVATQMVSNTHSSFRFVEELLHILDQAGCRGPALVTAYNFVFSAIVGFTTLEFARLPEDNAAEWQEQLKARLGSIDKRRFPTLAASLPSLENRSFVLRFQSGTERPLDDSFDGFVTAVLGGIETLARSDASTVR